MYSWMVRKQLTPKAEMTKTNNTIITHFKKLIFVKYNAQPLLKHNFLN